MCHRLAYHHAWYGEVATCFTVDRCESSTTRWADNGHAACKGSWNLGCLYLLMAVVYSNASPNFRHRCLCHLWNFSAHQKLTMYVLFQKLNLGKGKNTDAKLAPNRWWVWTRGCLSWRRFDPGFTSQHSVACCIIWPAVVYYCTDWIILICICSFDSLLHETEHCTGYKVSMLVMLEIWNS